MEKTYKHAHSDECDGFAEALRYKCIYVVNGEVMIDGTFPDGATAGNIITNETYNIKDFQLAVVLRFCPFCAKRIIYSFPCSHCIYRLNCPEEKINEAEIYEDCEKLSNPLVSSDENIPIAIEKKKEHDPWGC